MKKLSDKRNQGFALILPLLAIVFFLTSGLVVYNQRGSSLGVTKNILGESDNKGEGSGSSAQIENNDEENEALEPEETVEPEETPEPEEFEDEQEVEVKEGANKSKIKIRSGKNKFEFQQEGAKFSVESDFPLSVNPTTRELTVTTPTGGMVVAVLPQQAVDNMLEVGIVTTTSGVDLKTEADGSLSYNIDGTKNEKLLGVFDIAVPKNLIVSAQTGQVLTVNQSTFSKILDFLSI